VDAIGTCNLVAVYMDWMTKATLWIAALVLGSYFVWATLDCALDASCELRCAPISGIATRRGGGCVYQKADPTSIIVQPKRGAAPAD
jgi:hypothetical protein